MRGISSFSIKRPVAVTMIVLAILLLGYISFNRLGIDLFPELDNPRIFIELKAGEKPPEEIEEQFVQKIEGLVIREKGVVGVSSVIKVGGAQITTEYDWDTDMEEAFLNAQKAVTDMRQNTEGIDEINISQHDPNTDPIMLIALWHPGMEDLDQLRKIAENYIRNKLVRLEGVAEVEISGGEEKEVVIETDSYTLEAFGLSPEDVTNTVESLNRNVSGGSIVEMGLRYLVKGVSAYGSLEDIENVIVTFKKPESMGTDNEMGSQAEGEEVPVYLKDVAEVYLKNKDPESVVRLNGRRCLGLSVYREIRYNTVKITETLGEALKEIESALPGYEMTIIKNHGEFIKSSVDEVKQTALIGALLAIVVLYLFLRRLGTTAIISVAIPISVVATFNMMYFGGLTLNIMTIGGLALGAGMLVDNAIVVVESIVRNYEEGKSIQEASVIGTSQVGGAIVASTITTIVVFLPIVYLHDASSELFREQAWTVAFALISSLIVAVLVIPMLSSRFLKGWGKGYPSKAEADEDSFESGGDENKGDSTGSGVSGQNTRRGGSVRFDWYPGVLDRVLRRRWLVIILSALLVAVTVLLIPVVGSEFMPGTDAGEFSIELTLPEGTSLERTRNTVVNVEEIIRQVAGEKVETIYSRVGPATGLMESGSNIFEDENTADIKIILNKEERTGIEKLIAALSPPLSNIEGLEVKFVRDQSALQTILGTEATPINVDIMGDDLETLKQLSGEVKQKLKELEFLYNVGTSLEEGRPEVDVVVDRLRAGINDVGVGSITQQLSDKLTGREAGTWEQQGELRDIVLRFPDMGVGELEEMLISGGSGDVRLGEVAGIRFDRAPREIIRRNQIRIGRVSADYRAGMAFDHVIGSIEKALSGIDYPHDYRIKITGEEEKRESSFRDLRFALILSVILVYMVMASKFESLVHPFTILLTIPLAGVGAILIFLILGKSLNIMAYIGIIMLAGIAVNDSIILVDAINKLKGEGVDSRDAILEAGRRRIRPIIMTSVTTILALLPLTFGFGESASLRSPMALAVIGGLVTSTVLTLFVIPCVYSVLDTITDSGQK
jgi:HAE1 family hydrophobic/amphiphilic exporter-1